MSPPHLHAQVAQPSQRAPPHFQDGGKAETTSVSLVSICQAPWHSAQAITQHLGTSFMGRKVVVPISQIGTLRLQEVKGFVQGHSTRWRRTGV